MGKSLINDENLQKVYDYVYEYFEEYGYGPTLTNIVTNLPVIKSKSTLSKAIDRLIEVGMLEYAKTNGIRGSRTLRPVGVQIKMPRPHDYTKMYARKIAADLAETLGTDVRLVIGDGTDDGVRVEEYSGADDD